MKKNYKKIINYHFNDAFKDIKLGSYGGFGFTSFATLEHRHIDYYELTLITSGVFTHIYNNETSVVPSGNLLLMAPDTTHQLYTEPTQATFFAICIHKDFFQSFVEQFFPDLATYTFPKCSLVRLDTADSTYLEQLGHQLNIPKPSIHVANLLTYIALGNFFYRNNHPSKKTEYVQLIMNIFNNPTNFNISAKSIYATVDIAPSTLIKIFKEQTGYTITEYKNRKRIDCAAEMLRNSDHKVIDIANELYFDSLSHFLQKFKKEFGMTPSEYRKMHKK